MAEKNPVVESERISYSGYFSVKDLYNVVDEWLSENWYDRKETSHKESVHDKGKTIDITMKPWKTVTDYLKYRLVIKIQMQDIKDAQVGKKKFDDGTVHITIDAFLESDHEGRWQSTGWLMVFNFFFDRYVYSSTVSRYKKGLADDVRSFKNAVKSYFNFAKLGK